MSRDYAERVRAFARLNPGQDVPDTDDPVIFQAVARTLEEDHALSGRVMYELTLGENVRDVGRDPADRGIPDRERYATIRTAAVTHRARAAQRAAASALEDRQGRLDLADPTPPPTSDRDARRAVAERTPRHGVER